MTDRLAVDAAGLNAAAAASVDIAQGLAANSGVSGAGGQPSHSGVAALDGSLAAARARQSARVQGQGSDLQTAGAVYTHTNESAAENLTRTI